MAVHLDMGRTQKFIWILLIGGFLWLEFRAVEKDRADFADREAVRTKSEHDEFQRIADGITASMQENETRFDQTLNTIGRNINTVTGGPSFCYMNAIGNVTPIFLHAGDFPIYDVEARVVDLDRWKQLGMDVGNMDAVTTFVRVGDLTPHASIVRKEIALGAPPHNLNIFFSARNGFWTQEWRQVLISGRLVSALKVQRLLIDKGGKGNAPATVYQKIDKDFPRDKDGKIKWD